MLHNGLFHHLIILQIQPLTDLPGRLGRKTIVHAIHGPEASSELAMIGNFIFIEVLDSG